MSDAPLVALEDAIFEALPGAAVMTGYIEKTDKIKIGVKYGGKRMAWVVVASPEVERGLTPPRTSDLVKSIKLWAGKD